MGKRKIVMQIFNFNNKITADFSLYPYKCTDILGGMISLTNPKHLYFVYSAKGFKYGIKLDKSSGHVFRTSERVKRGHLA